ncbi:MarR family winged helix-turn-helix transcriptional regulator [Actinocatenispora comari]|uniref:MarR family transcriptional regulator n=1 Tax=Actinocatenispora comari TaxID=2807577 RepID=A0A8J4ADK2_9ACTN|nr:MarR family transcriptional regulator [Actinocatenispora comari]GIL27702.1 MarR family transcriptional regulator [Actinocatenispora comari]
MASSLAELALGVKRLQVRHHRAIDTRLAPLGLSLAQWDVLRHLHRHPDASLHDLARLTFQTDQSMGTLAGRMATRGLIERVTGPGRAVRHRITAEGDRLRTAAQYEVDRVLGESFGPLDESDRATLGDLLSRLLGPDMPTDLH